MLLKERAFIIDREHLFNTYLASGIKSTKFCRNRFFFAVVIFEYDGIFLLPDFLLNSKAWSLITRIKVNEKGMKQDIKTNTRHQDKCEFFKVTEDI